MINRRAFLMALGILALPRWALAESSYDQWLEAFLDGIREVETGGHPNPKEAVGDHGKSLGPYQIQRAYFEDARELLGKDDQKRRYEDVKEDAFARRVVKAYLATWGRAALKTRQTRYLARLHNGGPSGPQYASTESYADKVEAAMKQKIK